MRIWSNLTIPDPAPNRATSSKDVMAKEYFKLEQDYPSLDITADNFEFNKKNFGAIRVNCLPAKRKLEYSKNQTQYPDVSQIQC